jgi:hypothetical protein
MEKAPSASIEEVLGEEIAEGSEQSDSEFPSLKKAEPKKRVTKAGSKKAI